ncbi:16S rRNA (uracil(1498)-N(3))-methyltransferase [Xylanibacillus composti]|uniref:Ribosomal RNA small subunit methyltransferase E n=1 Tax=Xylanibacillus composti TaxID=1572762 RepID=A0A8J4H2J1_9BACL|nr:16S rRNA (uracil(1498)-N(3))-methyltransferase [Xylanibacillus composti]MDT9724442.1 16S rRNA (uracil(1498)-N(3))-methyltransferase [Xylanibacillus composti]GIQ69704.1 ribosomal RNA small subunit methyltransferase E [Xylanibacillus composti]
MQRYFVPGDHWQEDSVTITGDDAHHVANVMRGRAGDRFLCCAPDGRVAVAEITAISKGQVEAAIVEWSTDSREPGINVYIAQSLPKADKMETVIQRCTEIGAAGFRPFVSSRTIVQYDAKKEAKRLDRWHKIAKEAAEQAHRNRIPAIASVIDWKELLKQSAAADLVLLCYEQEGNNGIGQVLQRWRQQAGGAAFESRPKNIWIVVGPEGGFTDQEAEEAAAAGANRVHLGPRILRTETAALVALTCVLYECGEMGGYR